MDSVRARFLGVNEIRLVVDSKTEVVVAFGRVALVDIDVVTLDLSYRYTVLDYYRNYRPDCTDVAVYQYSVSMRHIQRNYRMTIHYFGQNVVMKSSFY